jgi:predicted CopG family antitoxin
MQRVAAAFPGFGSILKFKCTHVYYTIMPTRTLSITEEAYRALKAKKKEGESFTDVILRLTGNKGSARRLLEMMDELHSPELAGRVEQASKEFRKNFKTRDAELQ